jgi:hypothetical protein
MPNGTPDKTNAPSPFFAPGELGAAFADQNTGLEFLRVKLDPASSTGTVGAVTVGQLAYWKDKANAIVTNDKAASDVGAAGAINRVAGVFMTAVTATPNATGRDGQPLYYMCDIVIRGQTNVRAGGTLVAGAQAIADTTAAVSQAIAGAAVTTPAPSQVLGVWLSATITSGLAPMDVAIAGAE